MKSNGLTRLAVGVLAIAALGFVVAQADRLPGPAGELIRANVDADRDTTALFYTEIDGWDEWRLDRVSPVIQSTHERGHDPGAAKPRR